MQENWSLYEVGGKEKESAHLWLGGVVKYGVGGVGKSPLVFTAVMVFRETFSSN